MSRSPPRAFADLAVERRSTAGELDPHCRQRQHRQARHKQRERDQTIHHHFERVIAAHHEILLDLETQRSAQVARGHPHTGDTGQMRDHDQPPEIQLLQQRSRVFLPDVGERHDGGLGALLKIRRQAQRAQHGYGFYGLIPKCRVIIQKCDGN